MEAAWDVRNFCWVFTLELKPGLTISVNVPPDEAASMAGKIMNKQEQLTPDVKGEDVL